MFEHMRLPWRKSNFNATEEKEWAVIEGAYTASYSSSSELPPIIESVQRGKVPPPTGTSPQKQSEAYWRHKLAGMEGPLYSFCLDAILILCRYQTQRSESYSIGYYKNDPRNLFCEEFKVWFVTLSRLPVDGSVNDFAREFTEMSFLVNAPQPTGVLGTPRTATDKTGGAGAAGAAAPAGGSDAVATTTGASVSMSVDQALEATINAPDVRGAESELLDEVRRRLWYIRRIFSALDEFNEKRSNSNEHDYSMRKILLELERILEGGVIPAIYRTMCSNTVREQLQTLGQKNRAILHDIVRFLMHALNDTKARPDMNMDHLRRPEENRRVDSGGFFDTAAGQCLNRLVSSRAMLEVFPANELDLAFARGRKRGLDPLDQVPVTTAAQGIELYPLSTFRGGAVDVNADETLAEAELVRKFFEDAVRPGIAKTFFHEDGFPDTAHAFVRLHAIANMYACNTLLADQFHRLSGSGGELFVFGICHDSFRRFLSTNLAISKELRQAVQEVVTAGRAHIYGSYKTGSVAQLSKEWQVNFVNALDIADGLERRLDRVAIVNNAMRSKLDRVSFDQYVQRVQDDLGRCLLLTAEHEKQVASLLGVPASPNPHIGLLNASLSVQDRLQQCMQSFAGGTGARPSESSSSSNMLPPAADSSLHPMPRSISAPQYPEGAKFTELAAATAAAASATSMGVTLVSLDEPPSPILDEMLLAYLTNTWPPSRDFVDVSDFPRKRTLIFVRGALPQDISEYISRTLSMVIASARERNGEDDFDPYNIVIRAASSLTLARLRKSGKNVDIERMWKPRCNVLKRTIFGNGCMSFWIAALLFEPTALEGHALEDVDVRVASHAASKLAYVPMWDRDASVRSQSRFFMVSQSSGAADAASALGPFCALMGSTHHRVGAQHTSLPNSQVPLCGVVYGHRLARDDSYVMVVVDGESQDSELVSMQRQLARIVAQAATVVMALFDLDALLAPEYHAQLGQLLFQMVKYESDGLSLPGCACDLMCVRVFPATSSSLEGCAVSFRIGSNTLLATDVRTGHTSTLSASGSSRISPSSQGQPEVAVHPVPSNTVLSIVSRRFSQHFKLHDGQWCGDALALSNTDILHGQATCTVVDELVRTAVDAIRDQGRGRTGSGVAVASASASPGSKSSTAALHAVLGINATKHRAGAVLTDAHTMGRDRSTSSVSSAEDGLVTAGPLVGGDAMIAAILVK